MTEPQTPTPPTETTGRVQWYDPDMQRAYWVEVIRKLQDYEIDPEAADGQGPFYEIRVDYNQPFDPNAVAALEDKIVPQHSLEYLPYELPSWQAQALTLDQWLRLATLCRNYKVPFDPTDYKTYSADGNWMRGFAEGWVGGRFGDGRDGKRTTIYVGVEPDGRSHS